MLLLFIDRRVSKYLYYFKYCKWKYNISENGKVIRIPVKNTIYRQRRKLRKMIKLNVDINITLNSFKSYLNIGNSHKYINYINKITVP